MTASSQATIRYVSPSGGNSYPYDDPTQAARVIQDAVNASVAGDTILVAEGFYNEGGTLPPGHSMQTRVVITADIHVKAQGRREATVISGNGAQRVLYMSSGRMEGFLLTNGIANGPLPYWNAYGGIAYLNGGMVSNCVLTRGTASKGGGACIRGAAVMTDSVILDNSSSIEGGGIFFENGGSVRRSLITMNRGGSYSIGAGGGIFMYEGGVLEDCDIIGNTAGSEGGGIRGYTRNEYGIGGTIRRCFISRNSAQNYGGGAYLSRSQFENNLVAENNANYGGGCAVDAVIVRNCSIVRNNSGVYGHGTNWLVNSIIWSDFGQGGNANWIGPCLYFTNCCTYPMPTFGSGNIMVNPSLARPLAGDYYLAPGSPCIDSGLSAAAPATDMDGEARPKDGNADNVAVADIGAFEFRPRMMEATIEDSGHWDDTARSTMCITAADVNGDGNDDLAMANSFQANTLFLGNGAGSFLLPADAGAFDDVGGFVQAHSIVALFANNDDYVDLAVGNYTEPNELYLNNGFGQFTLAVCGAFGSESRHTVRMCALDIEPDGDTDIAELCYMSPSCIYTNNGAGRLDRAPDSGFTAGGRPGYALAALDADNNGKMDLVAGYYGQACVLYTNDGRGRYWAKPAGELSSFVTTPLAIEVLDVNHDGKTNDLVVAGYEHACTIFTNNGHGVFTRIIQAGDFGNQVTYTRSLKACDFDGDDWVDIAVGNMDRPVEIYQNVGNCRFVKANIPALASRPCRGYSLAVLDADHQGLWDLAIGKNEQPSMILRILDAK
jgi:hypothetical protein